MIPAIYIAATSLTRINKILLLFVMNQVRFGPIRIYFTDLGSSTGIRQDIGRVHTDWITEYRLSCFFEWQLYKRRYYYISIRLEPRLPWYGNKLQTGPRVNQLSALLIYHGLWVDLKLYTSRFTVLKKLSNVSITHLNTKYSVFWHVFIERTETQNCYFCQLTCISQRPLQSTLFLSVKTSKINSSYAKVVISVCSNFKISMYLFFIIEKVKRTLFNSYLMR